ncbi:hemolysin family protein [Actinopolymorpha pittospori]|uniref:CBS domain containing-hemolysin-like protein n=1 Tax=Actinopolymorpha pittospori TaxID=648752 RepID=A0A927RMN8_9ACTN|nr:hemolysin family protein [Actinopolymorpha pittospori]MBE1609138.1 CBS domain containing-hemolysin-like protein [Actinopolymorpha pittospori]
MSVALGIVAVFVLTFGTGYFVAQEFSYVSADRVELSRQAAAGDKNAASAIRVMERLSFMLSAAQVGITVTGLLVGFIAQPALVQAFRPLLGAMGLGDTAVSALSVVIGFALATVIQMVLGELFPKNLALARSEQLAKALAPSTHVYLAIAGPVVRVFDSSSNWVLRRVGIEPVEELHHGATLEELGHIIGESEEHGSLSTDLSAMLERALLFSDRTAAQAMVPRPGVVSVRADDSAARLLELIAASGHSHHPVLGSDTDDVLGVAGVRELMALPAEAFGTTRVGSIARPALFVPSTVGLPRLLAQMREQDEEFACVVDEYGGLAGIVTLEDAAEELVGDIADENDTHAAFATQAGDWWHVDAARRTDEITERTGIELPAGPHYDTVAGMIVAMTGRLVSPGDHLVVPATPGSGAPAIEVEVLTVDRRVPDQVRLRVAQPATATRTEVARA